MNDTALDRKNQDSSFYSMFNNYGFRPTLTLLLPLVNFSQKGLQYSLNCFARMSFNGGYKLLIAPTLILLKHSLFIRIESK